MVIIKNQIFYIFIIVCLCNFKSYSQDTIVVVRTKWKTEYEPVIKSFIIRNDTVFEKKGGKTNHDENIILDKLILNKSYFIFIDKKNRRMMEGRWNKESIYGDFVFYFKDGNTKVKGSIIDLGCGYWEYYNKKGVLIKTEDLKDCLERD
jgi:hypothetical protein